MLFYRQQWAGDVGWGPRFMLPALPGLMLLTAPAVERLSVRATGLVVLIAVGILGCALQLASVLVPWQAAYESIRALGLEPYVYTGVWDARRWLPLHQLPLMLSPGSWSTAWLRMARLGSGAWVLPVALSAAATLVGLFLLRVRRVGLAVAACGLASLVVVSCAASSVGPDPAWHAQASPVGEAIAYVASGIVDRDVLLVEDWPWVLGSASDRNWSGRKRVSRLTVAGLARG